MEGSGGLRHNLPVTLTDFIGRRPEIAQLHEVSGQRRLVTLVGPAGAGKTRLAVEAGRELAATTPDGVWFADMSGLHDQAGVCAELARALDVREEPGSDPLDAIRSRLEASGCLVILDNCDHVVPECAEVAGTVISDCPGVRLWATSREPLGLEGESIIALRPLDVPPDTVATARHAVDYEAVGLFAAVAGQMVRGFAVDDGNFRDICQVCRRLDGLPLAIELAAARSQVLTPAQIRARLDDRFRLLTSAGRRRLSPFQTLRSALEWSYELLDARSRELLRQIAVFADTASLEALAFAGEWDEAELLDLLQGLVSKSLVTVERRTSDARYGLLESIRAYVLEAAVDSEWLAAVEQRRLCWYLQLAEQAQSAMRGPTQVQAVDAIRGEHKNLVAALEWASEQGDTDAVQRMAAWLWEPWFRAGRWTEAHTWIDRALSFSRRAETPILVQLLLGRGYLATFSGTFDEAREALDACMLVTTRSGDVKGQTLTFVHAGIMEAQQGDLDTAQVTLETALTLARQAGNPVLVERCLVNLGIVALRSGDPIRAVPLFEEALPLSRSRGDPSSELILMNNLTQLAIDQGDYQRAEDLLEHIRQLDCVDADRYMELRVRTTAILVASHRGDWTEVWSVSRNVLDMATELGDHEGMAMALEGCAAAVATADLKAGARLLGASETIRERARVPRPLNEQRALECNAPGLFHALAHDAAVQQSRREGRALGRREALAYVSTLAPPHPAATSPQRTLHVQSASLHREGDYWTVHYQGRVCRVRHVVGLDHLAVLLARPDEELHSLELHARAHGDRRAPAGAVEPSAPLLDTQAKRAYRSRLHELEQEIDEARAANDSERLARRTREHDMLVRELARAVGFGGRDRPGSSDAERARVRVTKALRGAVAALARVDADLGQHLRTSVRTGSFCSYRPGISEPVRWDVRR
jgi:predicted ATPase